MTSNFFVGESLWVFDQKTRERGTESNSNYELVIKDLIANFFLPKALQRQKRYLQRGLYKPRDINIRDFIWKIDEMVEYLGKFPPFGAGQSLSDYNIIHIVDFSSPKDWQNNWSSMGSIKKFSNPGTHKAFQVLQAPRKCQGNFPHAGWRKQTVRWTQPIHQVGTDQSVKTDRETLGRERKQKIKT